MFIRVCFSLHYQMFLLACFFQNFASASVIKGCLGLLFIRVFLGVLPSEFALDLRRMMFLSWDAWVRTSSEFREHTHQSIKYISQNLFHCYHQNSKIWLEPNFVLTISHFLMMTKQFRFWFKKKLCKSENLPLRLIFLLLKK